jgi:hypothetical protein
MGMDIGGGIGIGIGAGGIAINSVAITTFGFTGDFKGTLLLPAPQKHLLKLSARRRA